MPLYNGPEKDAGNYAAKFIRLGERLVVSEPDVYMQHDRIAELENILVEIEKLRIEDPTQVDAGQFRLGNDLLFVFDSSTSLKLPVVEEARIITIARFVTQSPGYEVIDQGMYLLYHR